jgi:hypothetical protein
MFAGSTSAATRRYTEAESNLLERLQQTKESATDVDGVDQEWVRDTLRDIELRVVSLADARAMHHQPGRMGT